MRFIRLIFFSVLSLFVIASVIGIMLPSHVLVSRAVNITAPKDSIRNYLTAIENWKDWMEGMKQANIQIISPSHADFGGTIVSIIGATDSTIISSWETKNGTKQISTMRLIGSSSQTVTVVQWQFEQDLKWYPWERFGSMMNDKILGTMMEKNLNNLRSIVEKHQ